MNNYFTLSVLALCTLVSSQVAAYECKTTSIAPSADPENFIDNGNGTITDLRFGLQWSVCTYGQVYDGATKTCTGDGIDIESWSDAISTQTVLNSENRYGHDDWRLPSIKELQSIVERQCFQPAINLNIFKGTVNSVYWSNTPDNTVNEGLRGRIIDFSDGTEFWKATNPKIYVRHVRKI